MEIHRNDTHSHPPLQKENWMFLSYQFSWVQSDTAEKIDAVVCMCVLLTKHVLTESVFSTRSQQRVHLSFVLHARDVTISCSTRAPPPFFAVNRKPPLFLAQKWSLLVQYHDSPYQHTSNGDVSHNRWVTLHTVCDVYSKERDLWQQSSVEWHSASGTVQKQGCVGTSRIFFPLLRKGMGTPKVAGGALTPSAAHFLYVCLFEFDRVHSQFSAVFRWYYERCLRNSGYASAVR